MKLKIQEATGEVMQAIGSCVSYSRGLRAWHVEKVVERTWEILAALQGRSISEQDTARRIAEVFLKASYFILIEEANIVPMNVKRY